MNCAPSAIRALRASFAHAMTLMAACATMLAVSAPATADLILDFPSSDSITGGPTGDGALGGGGGGVHFFVGDDLTRSFSATGQSATVASRWEFVMDDWTDVGVESLFDLQVNGTTVGTFSFAGEGIHSTIHTFDVTFEHESPIGGTGPSGDDFVLRMVATTTVPLGMGSWNWVAGGTVTLYDPVPAPGALVCFGLLGLGWRRRRR